MTDPSQNPASVAVVGSIHLDLVYETEVLPHPGETVLVTGRRTTAGGKGANQAMGVAAHGVAVAMIGAVGADRDAETVLTAMRERGVRLDAILRKGLPTGRAIVTVDSAGENMIMVDGGASAALDPADVRAAADVVAASSVLVLQGEIPAATSLEAARSATGTVILTPSPAEVMTSGLLERADILVPNRHEALRLAANGFIDQASAASSDATSSPARSSAPERAGQLATIEDAWRLLERLVPAIPTVLLTLGADGVLARVNGVITHVPSRSVEMVDSTGAGDAFVGAVAARLATGGEVLDAVVAAVDYAAAAVQLLGATPPAQPAPVTPPT